MKFVKVFKLGRLANGAENGKGMIIHGMPAGEYTAGVKNRAFCGTAPGRISAGWHKTELEITCPKCKTYIEVRTKARNVTAISRLSARCDAEPVCPIGVIHGMRSERFARGCRSQALCGAKPGPESAGWYSPRDVEVTCPKCLKRMARNGRQNTDVAEVDFAGNEPAQR